MKVTIEIDTTPEEARTFMGLPDLTGINKRLTSEMEERMVTNLHALQPDEMFKNWMQFGGQAQEQFMRLMQAATSGKTSL